MADHRKPKKMRNYNYNIGRLSYFQTPVPVLFVFRVLAHRIAVKNRQKSFVEKLRLAEYHTRATTYHIEIIYNTIHVEFSLVKKKKKPGRKVRITRGTVC